LQCKDHEGADERITLRLVHIQEAIDNTSNAGRLVQQTDNSFVQYNIAANTIHSYEFGHAGTGDNVMYAMYSRPIGVQPTLSTDNWGWYNDSANINSSQRVSSGNGNEGYYFYPWEYGYEYLIYVRVGSSSTINAVQINMPNQANGMPWIFGFNNTRDFYGAEGHGQVGSQFAPGNDSRTRIGFLWNSVAANRKLFMNGHNWGNERMTLANSTHCIYKRPIPVGTRVDTGGGGSTTPGGPTPPGGGGGGGSFRIR